MSVKNASKLSSDSESDDAEMCRFKEAAIGVELFSNRCGNIEKVEPKISSNLRNVQQQNEDVIKRSLRPKEKFHEEENELNTTPEFRAHVGKKLMSLVERKLQIDNVWQIQLSNSFKPNEGVFKLFRESDPNKEIDHEPQASRKRVCASTSSSDESEDERLAQAAITTQAVLSTSAIHHSKETKFNVTNSHNTSLCQEHSSQDKCCTKIKQGDNVVNCDTNSYASNEISRLNDGSLVNSKKKRKNKKKRQKEWLKNQSELKGTESESFSSSQKTDTHLKDSTVEKQSTKLKQKRKHKKKKSNKDH